MVVKIVGGCYHARIIIPGINIVPAFIKISYIFFKYFEFREIIREGFFNVAFKFNFI
jgi:hypothetical protein